MTIIILTISNQTHARLNKETQNINTKVKWLNKALFEQRKF